MATPSEIVDAARQYIGVKFLHQGRTRHGLDCIGLVIRVVHDLGLSDYDVSHYGRRPSGNRMQRLLSEHCRKIQLRDIEAGDLLHVAYDKQPQHAMIVTDRGVIHADHRYGVIEQRLDASMLARVRGAYRLPGVA